MTAHSALSVPPNIRASRIIRVMLVDDSKIARSIFRRVLSNSEYIEIAAEASTTAEALQHLENIEVDIILLDIEMPHRTGLDALPDIVNAAQGAPVLIVSSFAEENGPAAVKALSLGACDTLAKPGRHGFSGRFSEILLDKVIRIGREHHRLKKGVPEACQQIVQIAKPACVAIGASTGGIPIIYQLIKELSPLLDCPIFIVQHLPGTFMDFFARQLSAYTDRPVSVAASGIEVKPGRIYVAPGDAHLVCRKRQDMVLIEHVADPSLSPYCPSVDVLFHSVAKAYGSTALAIVLSGMGNDGTAGATELAQKGATIFAQDENSSVVWGMPGSIAKDNLATAILTPSEISQTLKRSVTS